MPKKYVVARKDVCAGQLLKVGEVDLSFTLLDRHNNEISEDELAGKGITISKTFGGLVCRGMLFNVNDDGFANDLIYTTPINYSIKDRESTVEMERDFVIDRYVELEELLRYLGYDEYLTQKDLDKIFRKFITHSWWLEHHKKLFGWKKLYDSRTGSFMGYGSGGTQTIPMNIYDNLSWISASKNGNPHPDEIAYKLIKKIK